MMNRTILVGRGAFTVGIILVLVASLFSGSVNAWQPYGPSTTVNWAGIVEVIGAISLVISFLVGREVSRHVAMSSLKPAPPS